MANPKGTPKTLGVIPLVEGEHSRPVRVRAPAWVFEELAQRSAAEVGRLLETALRGTGEPVALVEPAISTLTPPTALRDTPSAPTLEALGLSTTLLGVVDSFKAGAVAEYDYRERKWIVNDKSNIYAVYKRDLDKLVKAGLIYEENSRYRAK